ncbi:hypothetical protein V1264_001946 [Littorina saxatilis]|uniref:TIR domain-containing protein n=2 Tax=Littorina saxatilis TaxID=31220 RepID=A0AAN9C2J1_9CAEN
MASASYRHHGQFYENPPGPSLPGQPQPSGPQSSNTSSRPWQVPGGSQQSRGQVPGTPSDRPLPTQQSPGSQRQARGAHERIHPGSTQPSQSPDARGFPELSSSSYSSSPGRLQHRGVGSPDEDDFQRDVIKGVSVALQSAITDEGYASHCDPQKPSPSSTSPEEFSKSTSLVPVALDSDEEMEKYRYKFPKKLKIDYYDAMILYQDDDKPAVETFLKRVNAEVLLLKRHKPCLVLYDEILPDSGMTPIGQLDLVLPYCTYVLLYVTKEFCTDAWSEFSSQTCLMDAIDNAERRWSVVPIFTEPKRTRTFRVPPSIRSLKGIQYWSEDKFYVDSLRKLLEDKVNIRLENERKHRVDRQLWIKQKKGIEMREADEERQRKLHAEKVEKSETERHRQKMLAQEQAFQQKLAEENKQHQSSAGDAFKKYPEQYFGSHKQESQRHHRQVQLQTPDEFMKAYGDQYSLPQRDDSFQYMQYMQYCYQQGHYSHGSVGSLLPPKPGSVPANLDQFGKTGYSGSFPSLLHTYSVPTDGVSGQFSCPPQPFQYPENKSSSSPEHPAGKQMWPSSSMAPQAYYLHPRFSEAGSPQRENLFEGLPCPSKSLGEYGSMPGSGRSHAFQSQGEEPSRMSQSMPSVFGSGQPPTSVAHAEKDASAVGAVQQHLAGVGLMETEDGDERNARSGAMQSSEDSSQLEGSDKSDLVGDNPPESYPPGLGCPGYPPVTRLRHVGQAGFSESVEEPPLVAQGPAHHAESRSRAEPAWREGHQCVSPQYSAAGYGAGRGAPSVLQTQHYPQRHPYSPQPGHPGFQHPGYGPHTQQHTHQHYSPHPLAGPGAGAYTPAGYSSQHGYPPPFYPAYQGEHYPRLEQPPPQPPRQPFQQPPLSFPGQQPPTVLHYHYHDRGEPSPGTTVNYIKKVDQLMMGNEVNVRETRSRPSREQGEVFRNDDEHHPSTEEPNDGDEVQHTEDTSRGDMPSGGPSSLGSPPASRLTQPADQNIASRLTDTVSQDRSRVSSVSSAHHQEEPQPFTSGFRDLPTSHPQSHDVPSSCYPSESSTLRQQGRGVEQWHQQYEQEQETDLKRFIAGPSEDESMGDCDDGETDLKSKRESP